MKFWIVFVLLMIVSMAYAEDSEKKDGTDENGTVMLVQRKVKNGGATYRVSTEDGTILADSARVKPGTVLYVDVDVKRDDEGVFMLDAAYLAVNAYHTPKYYINGRMTEIEKGKRYKFTMSEWNADVSLSIFPLYTIKVYVEGNGSVTIKNTVRDTYKGENYYVSANVVFLVDADEGYYLSSVNMRNWNKNLILHQLIRLTKLPNLVMMDRGMPMKWMPCLRKSTPPLAKILANIAKPVVFRLRQNLQTV